MPAAAPAPIRPSRRRRRRRRLLVGAGLALLVGLGLLVAGWVARDAIATRLARHVLEHTLPEDFGWRASAGTLAVRVEGDLTRATVELEDLALSELAPYPTLPAARFETVVLELDLRALLAGADPVRSLRAEGGSATVDLRPAPGEPAEVPWPDTLPVAHVGRLALQVLLPGEITLSAQGVELDAAVAPAAPGPQPVELAVAALALERAGDNQPLGSLRARLGWREAVVSVLSEAALAPPDDAPVVLRAGSRVDLREAAAGRFHGELLADVAQGSLRLSGQALPVGGHERFVGELELEGLRLDRLPRALGRDGAPAAVLLSGTATLDAPLDEDDLHVLLDSGKATLDLTARRADTEDSLSVAGRLADGVLDLSRGAASTRGGHLDLSSGRIRFATDWPATRIELDVEADLPDLAPLGELLRPLLPAHWLAPADGLLPAGDWGGALAGRVRADGPLSDPQFEVALQGRDLRLDHWRLDALSLRAAGGRDRLRVEEAVATTAATTVAGRGTVDLRARSLADVEVDLRLDLPPGTAEVPTVPGPGDDPLVALLRPRLAAAGLEALAGHVEAQVTASGSLDAPSLRVDLHGTGLALGESAPADLAGVEAEAEPSAPGDERPAGRRVDALHVIGGWDGETLVLDRVEASADGTQLVVAGALSPFPVRADAPVSLRLAEFELRQEPLELVLREPATLSWDDPLLECPEIVLEGEAGRVAVRFSSERAATQELRRGLVVHVAGLRADLLPPGWRPASWSRGQVDVDLDLSWSVPETPSDAPGVAPGAAAGDPAAWLARVRAIHAIHAQGQLRVTRPDLSEFDLGAEDAVVRFELHGNPDALQGGIEGEARGLFVELPAQLRDLLERLTEGEAVEVVEDQESGPPKVAQEVQVGRAGRLLEPAGDEGDDGPRVFGPGTLAFRARVGSTVQLEQFVLEAPGSLRLDATGELGARTDLVALAVGEGLWPADAPVRISGRLRAVDIRQLGSWLGEVRRVSGEVLAEGELVGTLAHVQATGRIILRDGELRLASGVPAIDRLDADLELDEKGLTIRRFTGELGAAPFELTGNARFGAGDAAVEMRLRGEDLLIWRGQGVKVRADVDLTVRGPLDAPVARGRIVLRDSRVVRNINLLQAASSSGLSSGRLELFSFPDPPLSALRFDIAISSVQPFRLDNNLVRGSVEPNLRLTGTGAVPILVGDVRVLPTRVALPASLLRITGGRILFSEADPSRPSLEVAGEARVRGYDITVLATGPYDEPVLALSSTPPLPSEDVMLLLLTGQPPRGPAGGSQRGAAPDTLAVYVGQDLLARWFSVSADTDESVLDRLEIDYAEDVTTRGTTSLQVSYRLTPPSEDKGPILFLHGEKDAYDAVNFGLRWQFKLK